MQIRLCSYNIEWFNHLFNKDNSLRTGNKEKERFKAIGNVLRSLDPDLIGIIEAPNTSADGTESTIDKLEGFAASEDLRTNKALTGFISPGAQEIAVLYDSSKLTISHQPGGAGKTNPPFDGEFFFDTDDDRIKELYKHSRPPFEASVQISETGSEFRLIVTHTKSKGIFDSMDQLHWERTSRRNRSKILAECEWIRRRVDEWLNDGHQVVVMGDINDGPGMDYYELKYGRSGVEVVMGDVFGVSRILESHAGKPKWTSRGWKPSSARFKDRFTETYVNVLIDHILVSQGLQVTGDSPHRIWNPFENTEAEAIKNDLLKASDHFPVTIDLQF